MDKSKLQTLLKKLGSLEKSLPKEDTLTLVEQIIGEKYKDVSSKLKEDVSLQGLDKINSKLDKFKEDFNLSPIISSIEELQGNLKQTQDSITSQFNNNSQASELTKTEFLSLIKNTKDDLQGMTGKELTALLTKITALESQLSFQDSSSKLQGQSLKQIVSDFQNGLGTLKSEFNNAGLAYQTNSQEVTTKFVDQAKAIELGVAELVKFRKEMLARFSHLGGGSMNRNIAIGGNTSVLSRYTDINLKAGTNVTLTYANNNTTKAVDVTITASGGGGGGISRSINSISTPTTAGSTAATDYVYLVSGTTTLTLPTAVGNTNLYTVKNVGTGVVTVATTSSQTIDGNLTITLSVQYTSVDIESDTANWAIT